MWAESVLGCRVGESLHEVARKPTQERCYRVLSTELNAAGGTGQKHPRPQDERAFRNSPHTATSEDTFTVKAP